MDTDINRLIAKNRILALINKEKDKKTKFDFARELSYIIRDNADSKEYVDQYFSEIAKCFNTDTLDFLIILFKNEWYDLIKKHIASIIQMLQNDKNTKILSAFCEEYLEQSPDNEKLDNLTEIVRCLENSPGDLLIVAPKLRGYSEETDRLLEEIMQKHSLDLAKYLFARERDTLYLKDLKDTVDVDGYSKFIERILLEIGKRQDSKLNDIKLLRQGASAKPFEFKNMILKVGLPPKTYNMPNSKYFLQPLIRVELKSNKGEPFACVEVTNKVDTNFPKEEKTKENLYQFWKKIRDEGIIWTDVRWDNVGKLLQKNIPIQDGVEMYSDTNATGLDNRDIGKPLEPGNLVVIDLDLIYKENDPNIIWTLNGFGKEFEERYQKEKQEKKKKTQDER